ncbi:acyl-CoA dehydrogenase family protein [Aureimonas psammosilenae]|uniref:acyl-CoA dehydrogenase family protein n=1 Tax=Aureimonas psammosilenae TaxID=2495496 RepID=UPI00126132CE|nr:acyl-CoA dehydrogenase family protein [Aureimonas psammosilenae]
MRPDTFASPHPTDGALSSALRENMLGREDDGAFPGQAFALLHERGLVGTPPIAASEIGKLLRLLAEIGRGDLSVGRVFEGHVNTLILIERHGTPEQKMRFGELAMAGKLLGIWNTDLPTDPLRLENGRLVGAKNFASGVDGLSHAIVTVTESQGRVMIVAPLDNLPVDRSWWKPMGMRGSGSHIVDFTGLELRPEWVLGQPDSYLEAPWFFAGAIRFVAVHVGGMHAVFDVAVEHLLRTKRLGDPYQAHRVARMGALVEGGYGWLDRAAAEWRAVAEGRAYPKALIATVNAARGAVESAALAVLEEAERGVGAAGMIAPHPLERLIRDLRTYLRQPNPDGALSALGSAIAEGTWRPGAFIPTGEDR